MKIKKILFICLALIILINLSGCYYKETKPKIKSGEFKFSVTYEFDGKVETLEGIYVCKFVRIDYDVYIPYRVWDGKIEPKELRGRLVEDTTFMLIGTTSDGDIYLDFNLYPQYFLSAPGSEELKGNAPDLYILYNDEVAEEKLVYREYDPEILKNYGAKIINYKYDEPIENEYK